MTATLTFQLPEDGDDLNAAIHATRLAAALSDMDDYLRKRLKYEGLTDEVDTALQAARDQLREIMDGWDVSTVVDT